MSNVPLTRYICNPIYVLFPSAQLINKVELIGRSVGLNFVHVFIRKHTVKNYPHKPRRDSKWSDNFACPINRLYSKQFQLNFDSAWGNLHRRFFCRAE